MRGTTGNGTFPIDMTEHEVRHRHRQTACAWPAAASFPDGAGPFAALLEALPYRKDDVTASYRETYDRYVDARVRRAAPRPPRHRIVGRA